MPTQPAHRIRVWRYRHRTARRAPGHWRWCWCCQLNGALWHLSGGADYATPGEAADAGRQHLREVHGAV